MSGLHVVIVLVVLVVLRERLCSAGGHSTQWRKQAVQYCLLFEWLLTGPGDSLFIHQACELHGSNGGEGWVALTTEEYPLPI